MPFVRDDDFALLQSAVASSGWVGRTIRSNVDQTVSDLLSAARFVIDNAKPEEVATDPARWVLLSRFHVMGLPTPQGSKTRMPNGAMIEGSSTSGRAKAKSWRSAVIEAARTAIGVELPYESALRVDVSFRLPMPRSRPKFMQRAGVWPCQVKPDLDKLARGLLDGLKQGGLIRDDSQVFSLRADKYEVVGWTGANVSVSTPVVDDR